MRELPLATRLVLTVFLIAVGLGYCSALVQLHMKHSDQDGSPLPTPDNVVERFSGIRKFDGVFPKSKIEALISGSREKESFGKTNMTPAFFGESAEYAKQVKSRGQKKVDDARETEWLALLAFLHADADKRKAMYDADAMDMPPECKDRPLDEDFVDNGKVKVKSIIGERCGRCHDNQQTPNFGDFAKLEPLITAPPKEDFDYNGGKWVRSEKFITLECLTQSTHAHALSFAVLFAFTGLIYSFSSHPGFMRGLLAPVVLVAQVADISCWWLARLPLPYGPPFALTIMGTGAVVGLGLMFQILLSLFDMYRWRGRAVLALFFAVGLVALTLVLSQAVYPGLVAEKEKAKQKAADPTLNTKKEPDEQPGRNGRNPPGKVVQ